MQEVGALHIFYLMTLSQCHIVMHEVSWWLEDSKFLIGT